MLGRFDDAIAELRRREGSKPFDLWFLGYAYARAGLTQEAREILDELQRLAEERYVDPEAFGFVHVGLGDEARALDWLERAVDERTRGAIFLNERPIYDPLRSDPRFSDLVARVEGGPQRTR